MPEHNPAIHLERYKESHVEGITALYNDPAVTRQVLQMPFQTTEVWRKRLAPDNERVVQLVALHQGVVIGNLGLEQYHGFAAVTPAVSGWPSRWRGRARVSVRSCWQRRWTSPTTG